MPTSALDHVNVLTEDLEKTVAFYEAALELTRSENPISATGRQGAWMRDAAGNAIVHVVVKASGWGYEPYHVGDPTAALHHVAFRCEGFRAAVERLTAMGLEPKVNDGMYGLRQIFVTDPNAINIEMNFHGD